MLKFEDFVKTFSSLSAMESSSHARYIYEEIIWRDDMRVKMALASEAGVPALSVCAKEIENYCMCAPSCDVDLTNHTTKQSIGRMVKSALQPMGYQVCGKKSLAKELGLKYLKNASVYCREGTQLHVTLRTEGVGSADEISCVLE